VSDQNFLDVARDLAREAATEIMHVREGPLNIQQKADKSIVTQADLAADKIIRDGLETAFPEHVVLSEETGLGEREHSRYVWLVDPLDGTKAYAKGIPGFCIMIGLLKDGQPHVGVVIDPLQDICYEAIRGEGAVVDHAGERSPLQVSKRDDFSEMPLVISTGFPEARLQEIRQTLTGPVVDPINSVGIKAGLVVRQVGDIYINHHAVHLWDTCAPQIIVEEAGGKFTRLDGNHLSYEPVVPFSHNSLTLVSNGTHHQDLVTLLTGIF